MRIYNTLTRKKEELKPLERNEYNIYSCGPTVYDYFHIGNARPFIVFDTLRRYLEYRGNRVNFVQNFTDIDDKIIRRADEENKDAVEISEKFIREYFADADKLGIKRATYYPKVTETIPEIIEMIKTLIDKGYAYENSGDIYYSTRKFLEYGKLSKKNIDELEAGARVDVNENKKDPLDFVLWKKAKTNEPSWDSPWGKGRPGWHIECSVMSKKYLGDTIDIHGGGADLIFPHHENEIAQSEAANGKPFSRYFMHNGYINIDGKKMSKSLGNFWTVRDILKKYDGDVLRFFMLMAQYRSPINFSEKLILSAKAGLKKIEDFYKNLKTYTPNKDTEDDCKNILDEYKDKFIEAMDDDLNTAKAIGVIFSFISKCKSRIASNIISETDKKSIMNLFNDWLKVLGLFENKKIENDNELDVPRKIEKILLERKAARERKDYKKSYELRALLF
ncbi:MAG: cysteine--tRNA ligase [Clostridiales Family XIII bacterium]|jgi:cysteinyl-tRNA synthetase|nr:cysteine--tRNA ligase [Clostridiales Family XIII bacterium]